MLFLFLFSLLFCSSISTTIATHNRRILHQPFFPLDSLPPSQPPFPSPPSPLIPSASSTPNPQPFFPNYPSPPPPSLPSSSSSSSASFPANVSFLTLPQPSKPKTASPNLLAAAVTSLLAAAFVVSVIMFLHIRRRKRRAFTGKKSYRSDNSSRHSGANVRNTNGIPKLPRPSQTSSEFLYLGSLVSSHNGIEPPNGRNMDGSAESNVHSIKFDSPELRPLPPLSQPRVPRNHGSADASSTGDDEDEEFCSPGGAMGGCQSSVGAGSASRSAFAAIDMENIEQAKSSDSSSSSYSSSSSASPVMSVSLSISPPVSLSPRRSGSKSPVLVCVETDLPPAPPPPPPPAFIPAKESSSLALPCSLSADIYLRKSQEASPRLSNVSDRNSQSPPADSRRSQSSFSGLSIASDRKSHYPARGLQKSENSSPRLSSTTSPTRGFRKNQYSSLRILNASDQSLHSPERNFGKNQNLPSDQNSNFIQGKVPIYHPSPSLSVPQRTPSSPASIPPPPPPPPVRHWESPKTPTPQPREKMSKPSVLVAPFKPLAARSPSLVSPVVLPPASETVDKSNESQHEVAPKTKLKPLHWDKVRASSDREMVWDQIRSNSFKYDITSCLSFLQ